MESDGRRAAHRSHPSLRAERSVAGLQPRSQRHSRRTHLRPAKEKLDPIAKAIGKTDPQTGEPLEDFRTEILGFLGSNPNYQQLFKQALVDRDYQRTARQIEEMMQQAQLARDALMQLSQDLTQFNLEHYKRIAGRFNLEQLGIWCRESIVRLGGSVLPDGDFWQVVTPDCLKALSAGDAALRQGDVHPRTRDADKKCELLGIGHPLVDACSHTFRTRLSTAKHRASQPPVKSRPHRSPLSRDMGSRRPRRERDRSEREAQRPKPCRRILRDAQRLPLQRVPKTDAQIPIDIMVRSEEAIRLWVASRRTEFPPRQSRVSNRRCIGDRRMDLVSLDPGNEVLDETEDDLRSQPALPKPPRHVSVGIQGW